MICQSCGNVVDEGRSNCPNCGARVYSAPSPYETNVAQRQVYGGFFEEKRKKKFYRTIGVVLLIIGIPLFIIALFIGNVISWFICVPGFICIGAGIICILTNLKITESKL